MIEAIGNILHTGMNAIPPEYASIVANSKFDTFRQNTPDVTRYADITFTDGKVLRFVTQNKNKKYTANDRPVQEGKAQVGQLKPYAIQALGGAQITWVIASPYAPNNQQTFLGHVFNGVWKAKQDNAYSAPVGAPANAVPGTYVPSQPDPGYEDPNVGYVDPNVSAPAGINPQVAKLMPLLMQMLQDIEKNKPVEQPVAGTTGDGLNI